MHWTRLADLPIAAVILAARPLFGQDTALSLAVWIVPGGLLIAFLCAFFWAVLPLVGRNGMIAPVLLISGLMAPFTQFAPGRVDHHGWQLLLAAIGMGFLIRAVVFRNWKAGVALGLVGGLALFVGLEAQPWLGGAAVALGFAWILSGGRMAAVLAGYGVALSASTLILIPLTVPVSAWGVVDCDRLSFFHLALGIAVALVGLAAIALPRGRPEAGRLMRLVAGGVAAAWGIAGLITFFPQCLASPFSDMPPEVRFWFDRVIEAQPMIKVLQDKPSTAALFLAVPMTALVITAWLASQARARAQAIWLTLLVMNVVGMATQGWWIRGGTLAALIATLSLSVVAAEMFQKGRLASRPLPALCWRFGLPLYVLLVPVVAALLAAPKPDEGASLQTGTVARPVSRTCDLGLAFATLRDAKGLGARPLVLAAPVDLGPQLLFMTPHAVLGAPYHRNVGGILDNFHIMTGTADEALATIRRRGVGAVLICDKMPEVRQYRRAAPGSMLSWLVSNKPPSWLQPVMMGNGVGLYRVRLPAP